jgi:hypothetical protein
LYQTTEPSLFTWLIIITYVTKLWSPVCSLHFNWNKFKVIGGLSYSSSSCKVYIYTLSIYSLSLSLWCTLVNPLLGNHGSMIRFLAFWTHGMITYTLNAIITAIFKFHLISFIKAYFANYFFHLIHRYVDMILYLIVISYLST